MLILSLMPRRGRGIRMAASVRVICVVRVLVVLDGRCVVMLRVHCIAVRMTVAPANTQRKLQRQHHRGQQCKQV